MHQKGVDREESFALPSTKSGEGKHHRNKAERAQEDVAIDGKKLHPRRQRTHHSTHRSVTVFTLQHELGKRKSQCRSRPLCHERPHRYTGNAPMQPHNESKTDKDIDQILHNGHYHRVARILHAQQPAVEGEEGQHGRCAPDKDIEVDTSGNSCRRSGSEEAETERGNGLLKEQKQQPNDQREHQRAPKQGRRFIVTSCAVGLCGESAGAHA